MNKIRINELAVELKVKAHEILDRLPELGVMEKKTHSSSIDEDVAIKLRLMFTTPKTSLGVLDHDDQLPAMPRSHPIDLPLSGLTTNRSSPALISKPNRRPKLY